MKTLTRLAILGVLATLSVPAAGQAPRQDAIWARVSPDPITLDGVLNEPAWAQAETKVVQWGVDNGIPGSGYKLESGWTPVDPTNVTLRFLVRDDQLYLGATVPDASIGGSIYFNFFDGFLMAIKDHASSVFPQPPVEYLYSWWYPETQDPQPVGQGPAFWGRYATWPPGSPRTPAQIANWDAATVVNGVTNDDTTPDIGWTVEMRFNLAPLGYNVGDADGDVIEWNLSVYDTDRYWPATPVVFTSNRSWWQGPWGNDNWYNEVRIFARPDVTTTSGPVPAVGPEVVIKNIAATPTIDGALNDAVWSDPDVYTFDIRYNDAPLRATYDGVGPWQSGQFKIVVYDTLAVAVDPGDATVKVFHSGDRLYFGFEVRDAFVNYQPAFDRWDGAIISLNERVLRHADNNLLGRRLSFQVGADGEASPQDYLLTLVTAGDAQVALDLMAGTTLDTLGLEADTGYTAEVAIDLTALGYPSGLGDGTLFFGVTLLDGDTFENTSDTYATRTWWYREYEHECCAPWAYLQPSVIGVEDEAFADPASSLARSVGSPSRNPRIAFALPRASLVTLEVFDVRGRLVSRRPLGEQMGGEVPLFTDQRPEAGVYLYRLQLIDPQTGATRQTLHGKTVLLK